ADALAAVARADERAPCFGAFPVELQLLVFIHPATEDTDGPIIVFMLAAFILALDFDLIGSAAFVPNPDRAFRLVDVLPACPPRLPRRRACVPIRYPGRGSRLAPRRVRAARPRSQPRCECGPAFRSWARAGRDDHRSRSEGSDTPHRR